MNESISVDENRLTFQIVLFFSLDHRSCGSHDCRGLFVADDLDEDFDRQVDGHSRGGSYPTDRRFARGRRPRHEEHRLQSHQR